VAAGEQRVGRAAGRQQQRDRLEFLADDERDAVPRGLEKEVTVDARGKTRDDDRGDVLERKFLHRAVGGADELSVATRQIGLRGVDADDVVGHGRWLTIGTGGCRVKPRMEFTRCSL
jgi:hypothetical protein